MPSLSLLHIVPGLDPIYGGPSYSVPRLCSALHDLNAQLKILTVRGSATPNAHLIAAFPQEFARIPLLRKLRVSSSLARAARRGAGMADIIHVHGLWLMPNVYAGYAARRAEKPLIVSPRGMLSAGALAYSRLEKSLFWGLLQGPAYARAACWHATSEFEAEELRSFGIKAPIAVIPNGIDVPLAPVDAGGLKTEKTVLFLGRLHPKKGLDRLIEAWPAAAAAYPNWRLRIVGPEEGGYRTELEGRVARSGAPRVTFDGARYGEARDAAFREADLFVLPTRSENFGLTVAEALAAETPAIVSKGAPWPGLESERCGWWIEQGVEPLVEGLCTAMALTDGERKAMGMRGREWVTRAFAWSGIAEQTIALYRWTMGLDARPSFVRTD